MLRGFMARRGHPLTARMRSVMDMGTPPFGNTGHWLQQHSPEQLCGLCGALNGKHLTVFIQYVPPTGIPGVSL